MRQNNKIRRIIASTHLINSKQNKNKNENKIDFIWFGVKNVDCLKFENLNEGKSFAIRRESFDLTFDGCSSVSVYLSDSNCLTPFGTGLLCAYKEADGRAVPVVNRVHALPQPNENICEDIPKPCNVL